MKKIILKPLALMALTSFFMFGCASSNEEANTTAVENTTMSESMDMAGRTSDNEGLDVLVIQEQATVPIGPVSITALSLENTVEINDMFDEIDDTEKYDVLALAKTSPNLSTFVYLLEQANLVDDLERVEKATLFAPTNEAFAKMPREKLESLLKAENRAMLSRMLQAHIIASDVSSVRLGDNDRIRITENSFIPIDAPNVGTVRVGGARLVSSDIEASNGRIHVIDTVILPEEDVREEGTVR